MANKPAPVTSTKKIQWIIKNATRANLEKYNSEDKDLLSDCFNLNSGDDVTQWFLYLYTDEEWLKLYFCRNLITNLDFQLKVTFDIEGKIGEKHGDVFDAEVLQEKAYGRNLIKLDELFREGNGLIDQFNRLILNCEMTLTKKETRVNPQHVEINENRVCEEYREFLNENSYSDCSFTTSDKVKVPGHRVILTKRSPGFKKILEEMKTQKRKTRVFENINSETLKAVMSYIYTGNVTLSQNSISVISVLKASIKFEIDDLKSLCIDTLISQMNLKNVLEFFEIAVDKELDKLEAEALKFIMNRFLQITGTQGWTKLKKGLRNKIFEALSGYQPCTIIESTL